MNRRNKERRLKALLSTLETFQDEGNMLDFWRMSSNKRLPSILRYSNNREISRDIDKLKARGFLISRKVLNFRESDCSFQRVCYYFKGWRGP